MGSTSNTLLKIDLNKIQFELSGASLSALEEFQGIIGSGQSAIDLAYQASNILEAGHQRRSGAFYTPISLVHEMVDELVGRISDCKILNCKILDPACGSGLFLLVALEKLSAKAQLHSQVCPSCKKKGDLAKYLIENVLFGADISPLSTAICAQLLDLKYRELSRLPMSTSIRPQIMCCNSLLPNSSTDEPPEFPNAFNYIIGNPPYGLSRGEQISPQENLLFKQLYAETRTGKVNKYIMFLARSYQLLEDGGNLSFVIPNAWLGIQGGKNIRKLLLEDGSIESIRLLPPKIFPRLNVETVVVCIAKKAALDSIKIISAKRDSIQLPRSFCLAAKEYEIPLAWEAELSDELANLELNCLALGSEDSSFQPMIALQAYGEGRGSPPQTSADVSNHVFDRSKKEGPNILPYLDGKHVDRYEINWPANKFLCFGPYLAEYPPIERFQGPRILVREILGKQEKLFKACFTNQEYLYNRSILHILPKRELPEEAHLALVAILNSPLASLWLSLKGKKTQRRLFPKLVNQDLKNFPIPKNFLLSCSELALLSKERHDIKEANSKVALDLEQKIHQAVLRIYGLPRSSWEKLHSN